MKKVIESDLIQGPASSSKKSAELFLNFVDDTGKTKQCIYSVLHGDIF
jgi:hypothetical protein